MDAIYHIPAMLKETIEGLNIKPEGTYVDVTFGGGGHSRAILGHLGDRGHLYSLDQDADALQNAIADERWTFVHSNFRYLSNWMDYYEVEQIDGLLADLGVSFHHFDCPERGFSFRHSAPLDMRMNQTAKRTAADIVNSYSEEELARLFWLYGEMKNGRGIAKNICRRTFGGLVHAHVQRRGETKTETALRAIEMMKTNSQICQQTIYMFHSVIVHPIAQIPEVTVYKCPLLILNRIPQSVLVLIKRIQMTNVK